MKEQTQHLLAILEKINPVDSNVTVFEETLHEISLFNDPAAIIPLLNLLDDSAESDDIMFDIIHYIESFDDTLYVSIIINSANEIYIRVVIGC
ncbi:MAG: Imm30 family immunity protein [Hymenobacter sp.]